MRELTFDEWVSEFNPEENLFDEEANFEGILFATDGEELKHIVAAHPKRIWTYRSDHLERKIIVKGFLPAHALGYFLCDRPESNLDEIITVREVDKRF